jgi:hypothetical protein
MYVKLPKLSILAAISDSETDMYVHPSGHMLFVSIPPDDDILMFVVTEDLNSLSEHEVNNILQRELQAGK